MTTQSTKKAVHGPIVPFAEFAARVKAVARGEEKAPVWAGKEVYATEGARTYWTQPAIIKYAKLAALTKLLADNQDLLGAIHGSRPASVSALAKVVKRSDSNVSRSLGKLEKYGIVTLLSAEGKAKQPVLRADRVVLELDVLSGRVLISCRDGDKKPSKGKSAKAVARVEKNAVA